MSSTYIKLSEQYEKENEKDNIKTFSDLIDSSQDSFGLSEISKSKFSEPYHIYCRKCERVQVINFVSNYEVKLICECKGPSKVIPIKDCFKYLYKSDIIGIEDEKLKCYFHPDEKYGYYCEICGRNKCFKCVEDDIDHKYEIKHLAFDYSTPSKRKYIWELIKEKNQYYIDNVEYEFDDDCDVSKYKLVYKKNNNFKDEEVEQNENISNDESDEEGKLIMQKAQKSINTDEVKQQIINIMNDNNKEFDENDCFLMNLLTIILDDSQNYPNFSHIKTISNVEKFIILYFNQYNEIKLKYEFEEENINNNKIKLFDALFVQRNRQKSFLIINKNIMELNSLIDLKDIFDKTIPQIRPIILDVKLIERKNQLMDDLSYMFSDISTIREINFYKYNSHNIKSISYMFNNCSSIKELPDISSLNTIKVTDMSYIFNNCSSIKNLPDISKWNTRNVTNMSCMFYNCISLEILPDISSWNIKRLTSYSYMFCGCKLIPNFEILSKWKLTDKSQIETTFQGCDLFIEQIRSRRNCNFSDYLISICKNLRKCCCKICEFFCKYFCKLVALIVYLIILLWIITILIFPFYPYYSSFHFSNKKKIILKIKQNLKLINKTNITRISSFLNITNSSLIKEMSENKEGVISNILDNITKKNNISLGKNQKTFKVYSIIIAITTNKKIQIF